LVDAGSGAIAGAIASEGGSFLFNDDDCLLSSEQVLKKFKDGFEHPEVGHLDLEPEALQDRLVWRASQESLTEFLPFWRFIYQLDGRALDVFVRIDAQPFYALNDAGGW
jgi:hypothetical protein